MEEILKNLRWEKRGVKIVEEMLSNLRFADDVVLLSEKYEDLKIMFLEVVQEGENGNKFLRNENFFRIKKC